MKSFLSGLILTLSLWPSYALLHRLLCRRYGQQAILACVVPGPMAFACIRLLIAVPAQWVFMCLLVRHDGWHWFVFCYLMLLLSLADAQLRLLPDYVLVLMLSAGGVALAWRLPGMPAPGAAIMTLAGAVLCSTVLILKYCRRPATEPGLAAGDIKLITVLTVWFSYEQLPLVLLLASFSGLVYILVIGCVTGVKPKTIAFGPCLALGSIAVHLSEDATLIG